MKLDHCNKTAVITGASRGLGASIAKTLWNEGLNLILIARTKDQLQQIQADLHTKPIHLNQTIDIIITDLADVLSVDKLTEKLITIKVDILVNNAAIQGPIGPIWKNDWQEWQQALQVNLLAPVAICRALIPKMIKRRSGKIINLSGGGATSPRANFSAYTVAKAGLVRFSETLAKEVKVFGIDVNCIAPGVMSTGLLHEVVLAGAENAGEKEYNLAMKNNTSDNATLERAASLCAYLVSSAADGITGKLISAVWDPWMKLTDYKEELKDSDIYTLRRIVPKDRGKSWGEVE